MFLEAVLLGLLAGRLRGGRTLNIGTLEFKGWVLIVIGFLLQMLPMLLGRMSWMAHNGHIVAFATMLLVFFIVVLNSDKRGFWLVTLGAVLNIVAMATHGLRMPVYLKALAGAGRVEMMESLANDAVLNHIGLEQLAHWSDYLGKNIAIPAPYPLAYALSVGDVLMSIGIFLFVMGHMTASHYFKSKGRMMNTFYPLR